jgi:hypothetical protein
VKERRLLRHLLDLGAVPPVNGGFAEGLHPTFDFKKHGNRIHPPICFLFKCVS